MLKSLEHDGVTIQLDTVRLGCHGLYVANGTDNLGIKYNVYWRPTKDWQDAMALKVLEDSIERDNAASVEIPKSVLENYIALKCRSLPDIDDVDSACNWNEPALIEVDNRIRRRR